MGKLFGKHRAQCKDVHDPERLGRIRVYCPSVYGTEWSDWAYPNFPPGSFKLPAEGDYVWLEFEEGDAEYPIWTGIWYDRGQSPRQDLHDPHTGRTGLVDKDKTEHESHPIDSVERAAFREGRYYDATRQVIYSDEQGMQIWVEQWTDGTGGLFFQDRAGNELHIKDNLLDTFKYSDMSGNIIQMKDNLISFSNGQGAAISLEGDTLRFKAAKVVYDVPEDGISLTGYDKGGKVVIPIRPVEPKKFTPKEQTKEPKPFLWRGQVCESDDTVK